MHMHGFVHLDIKPENVFLDAEFRVKLGDFGLAQPIGGEDGEGVFSAQRCGDVNYWAPEIVKGAPYRGVAADLYALAKILFIMVIGYPPWSRADVGNDAHYKKFAADPIVFWMTHPAAKIHVQRQSISREIIELLTRLLAIDPSCRPSLQEIRDHAWLTGQEPCAPAETAGFMGAIKDEIEMRKSRGRNKPREAKKVA